MEVLVKKWFFDHWANWEFDLEGGKLVCRFFNHFTLSAQPGLANACSIRAGSQRGRWWVFLGVLRSFSRFEKWVKRVLCRTIVRPSSKRITIKQKRYFLNPDEIYILTVAAELGLLVCSGCAALSQQRRTSVNPAVLHSQGWAKQVEWISSGLPRVENICIFQLLKSNFSSVKEDAAFGSRPLQSSSTLTSTHQIQGKLLALCSGMHGNCSVL